LQNNIVSAVSVTAENKDYFA